MKPSGGLTVFYVALSGLSIPLANGLIGNVGTFCVPDGPCVIPVWPGISAPSGVLAIGAAPVLRDLVQRRLGVKWAIAAITVGAALSGLAAPSALIVASVEAFTLSEIVDLAVFTPLRRRGRVLAVAASGVVGIAVLSAPRSRISVRSTAVRSWLVKSTTGSSASQRPSHSGFPALIR